MIISEDQVRERLAASTYLTRILKKYPELDFPPADQAHAELLAVIEQVETSTELLDLEAEQLRIRALHFKARFVLAWCVADISQSVTMEELGRIQARFAQCTIELALQAAMRHPDHQALLKPDSDQGTSVAGLFILGLGKLGGKDLNFSSDIDLVAFYERHKFAVNPMQGPGDVAARLLKWVTRFLEGEQGADILWRVDWRLRPEASATQLAMSVNAALDYYYFRAVPWHRLAMMKARPVAGDIEAANSFLDAMERFIWRQNLDFRALDELAELKDRIDLEHPNLKRNRTESNLIARHAAGVNLKLGSGGIREVEFFANALQLVWGGKKPDLRVTHTVTALHRLAEEGLISTDLAEDLTRSYWQLRQYENRLQMLDDRQTHQLPVNDSEKQRFAQLSGLHDWSQFEDQLYDFRKQINTEFSDLFRSDEDQRQSDIADPDWPELSEINQEIVQMWAQGFQGYGLSSSQAGELTALYRYLAQAVLKSGRDAGESIQRLHAFFRRLPPGGQYFRLLQRSPALVDGLIVPLLYSPPMQTLLEQTPHIIDALLEASSDEPLSDEFVFHSPDYEVRLERMRRLVNEQLYLIYLSFLNKDINPFQLQNELTELAEFSLRMALRVVCEKLEMEQPPVCIFGLGKLGMAKMSPLSDLDILYVSAEGIEMDMANRFVNRLQTALSTPMKEGVVYEMDMRLRPSGQSGPPTVGLASFDQYQNERAKTWEHQALVTARPVAGNRQVGERVMQARRKVLSRSRAAEQLRMDARKMLERLREERIVEPLAGTLRTKLRPGGLMETEYLISYMVLRNAHKHPHLLDLQYDDMVEEVASLIEFEELPKICQFWRNLQTWERLLGLMDKPIEEIPVRFQPVVLQQLEIDRLNDIEAYSLNYAEQITSCLNNLLEMTDCDEKQLKDWVEQPIEWVE